MPFSTYQKSSIGSATITPDRPVEAGSLQEVVITYTAGRFGLDDTGGLKISWRSASDSSAPQFTDPKAPNYTTGESSNGAGLALTFQRANIRPWAPSLLVRVSKGYIAPGDTIAIRLGDRRQGSPGYRLQTAAEAPFQFKTFVDAFATYDFVELENSPRVTLVPGRAVCFKAILPTIRRVGEPFRLGIVAEDRWGNVTDKVRRRLILKPSHPIAGLPQSIELTPGNSPVGIEGLSVREPQDLRIELEGEDGNLLVRSNPLRIVEQAAELPYWGDIHGQSGETVGTGTAAEYFAFARDKAFLDITGHQANDFQVDDAFWEEINRLTAAYDKPGSMVALPGYEWSGNTGVGGDRNVFFATEGRTIRRSSSVLLKSPQKSDVHHVKDLFEALSGEDAVVIAHVGGRYANLEQGHDGRIERAVEIHSCWGTFEWLLHEAIALGHRVGVVCHSDDHKGRPGAAYPGASQFGAMGGLTCYPLSNLDRGNVFQALRRRRTYGTTGTRLLLDVKAALPRGSIVYSDDPKLGPAEEGPATSARMGDVVRVKGGKVALAVEVLGSAPIERVTLFDGAKPVATARAYSKSQLGKRVRVLFEGAEYRGRGRETFWRGIVRLISNRFTRANAINHFNADKPLRLGSNGDLLEFDTVTTGNFSGFDLWLEESDTGEVDIASNQLSRRFTIADIGYDDTIVDLGGLGRRLRLFRLPDASDAWRFSCEHSFEIEPSRDNALYVRVTQEDGHQAWSSPIYITTRAG
jgi:hypothetical protein